MRWPQWRRGDRARLQLLSAAVPDTSHREPAADIAADVNVLKVGVFVNESRMQFCDLRERLRLDVVQLHGDETPEQVPAGMRVWKASRNEQMDADRSGGLPGGSIAARRAGSRKPAQAFDWTPRRRDRRTLFSQAVWMRTMCATRSGRQAVGR